MSTDTSSTSATIPTFSSKRRKTNFRPRTRAESPDSEAPSTFTTSDPSAPPTLPIIRRPRHFGPQVSSSSTTTPIPTPQDAPTDTEVAAAAELTPINRFTHQTGQILDVDKHMMAYIESRMSSSSSSLQTPSTSTFAPAPPQPQTSLPPSTTPSVTAASRSATLGKLHEVDLGPESRARNLAATSAALTPAEEAAVAPPTDSTKKRKKGPRPRSASDLERDRLVEEILKETRLDLYTPAEEEEEEEMGLDGDADERIAERFRKEFIEAIVARRRKRGPEVKKGAKEEKGRPKGPKLGGSRMARAMMRESLEKGGKK